MASKSSIAIRRNSAIVQCQAAIRALWGEDFELPLQHRDPAMLAMLQIQAIADYLSQKAEGGVTTAPPAQRGRPRKAS